VVVILDETVGGFLPSFGGASAEEGAAADDDHAVPTMSSIEAESSYFCCG
jgi:hypothetical protein